MRESNSRQSVKSRTLDLRANDPKLVALRGLEPRACRVETDRSILMSYRATNFLVLAVGIEPTRYSYLEFSRVYKAHPLTKADEHRTYGSTVPSRTGISAFGELCPILLDDGATELVGPRGFEPRSVRS